MKAREGVMASDKFGDKLKELYPVVEKDLSDSGSLDCCVEFLMQVTDDDGFITCNQNLILPPRLETEPCPRL